MSTSLVFSHSCSPGTSPKFREFGNSGNCRAKRLCCKAKSLPRAWELLGSDIYSFVLSCSPLGIPRIWDFWEFLCEIALLQGKIISIGFGIIGKSYLTAYVSELGVFSFLLTRYLSGIPGIVVRNVFAVR